VVKAVDHAELETSMDGPGSISHRLAAPSRTRVRYLDRSGTEPHPGDLQVGLFPGEVVFNCVRSITPPAAPPARVAFQSSGGTASVVITASRRIRLQLAPVQSDGSPWGSSLVGDRALHVRK
jgi:hypothetical protein